MGSSLRRLSWPQEADTEPSPLLTREWLVTNGLGGYASGSVAGICTRRFHGLLIAALPAPKGRTMMFNHLTEQVRLPDGSLVQLGGEELAGGVLELYNVRSLIEFRLESGLPVWRFQVGDVTLEKRIVLPHMQNTVHVLYRMLAGRGHVRLRLRPSIHFRPHEGRVDEPLRKPYTVTSVGDRHEVQGQGEIPPLKLAGRGTQAAFILDGGRFRQILYRVEQARGYDYLGFLWSPGYVRADLVEGRDVTLSASTESWDTLEALSPQEALEAELARRRRLIEMAPEPARRDPAAELVLAADQFIITPHTRLADMAWARATGDEVRTIIAGYHGFTDWSRDTMIALEGLTLATGRHADAGYIVRTFSHYLRDGLLPNLFPEGEQEGRYNTADATLWYFHAVGRYVQETGDRATLRILLPRLIDVIERHLQGTRFGIGVDPRDGLLRQGHEGCALTWMDARVDDWVVTPRRGKAVEINALWYNALRLTEEWVGREQGEAAARPFGDHAARTYESFNRRFWYAQGGHLYDVIDGETGDDASLRPNQLLALSLAHPVLEPGRWEAVLNVVLRELLTPLGLRSLAQGHADYRARYDGDLRARDAAYHQGTVWGWLVGPLVDAWLRVHPGDRSGARRFLEGFIPHLGEACLGSISEIFDAEEPFAARGCVAQAWSVAEVLRCWIKTA